MSTNMDCGDPSPLCPVLPLNIKEESSPKKVKQPADQTGDITSDIEAQPRDKSVVDACSNQNGLDASSSKMPPETPSLDTIETSDAVLQIKTEPNMDLQTIVKEVNLEPDVINIVPLQVDMVAVKEEGPDYVEMLDANVKQEINSTFIGESTDRVNSTAVVSLKSEIGDAEPLHNDVPTSAAASEAPLQQDISQQNNKKAVSLEYRKCFVRLTRLSSSYIIEKTQLAGGRKTPSKDCAQQNMPESAAVFPDGINAIQTENGVWSAKFLPKGTVFGPYDPPTSSSARLVEYWTSNMKIKQGREQYNMVAEIVEKFLYYRTVRDIQPETELICKIKHKPGDVIGKPGKSGKYFKCRYCKKLFVHRCALNVHLRIHTGENPHKCHKCGRSFNQISGLTRHVQDWHTANRRMYKCKECGKLLLSRNSLEYHMATHIGQKVYKCPQCGKHFSQKGGLKVHLVIHTGQKRHKCPECPRRFCKSGNLLRHIKSHAEVRPYECAECGKAFKRKEHLKLHIDIHLGKKDHKCPICDKQFTQAIAVKVHMRVHTGETPYECDGCGKQFKEKATVTRHKRLHTGERPYKCDQCDKAYISASNLTFHKKSHTTLPKYECATCQSRFSNKRELQVHAKTHTGKKTYKCDKCGKGFVKHLSLDLHMGTHIESAQKKHLCQKCGKSNFTGEYLRAHMRIHGKNDETPKCKECGKIYSSFGTLRLHMVTHLEKKPHQCEQCRQYFSQKAHLKLHLAKHSGVKAHKCEICEKRFFTHTSLDKHKIIHTDKKDHKCDICDKTFLRKPELKSHMRQHTGERPHECEQCSKRFATTVNLRTHSRVHSGEKPHECEECGRCFAQKANLKVHKKVHRKIE